jgi:hypothetical protein
MSATPFPLPAHLQRRTPPPNPPFGEYLAPCSQDKSPVPFKPAPSRLGAERHSHKSHKISVKKTTTTTAGKSPRRKKNLKPDNIGDCHAVFYLSPHWFDVLLAAILRLMGSDPSTPTITTFDTIKWLLGGHLPLSASNWRRTLVASSGANDKRVIVIGKEAAVGHKQLIDAAKSNVIIGISVNGDSATIYDTNRNGSLAEQADPLFTYFTAVKRTGAGKSNKPIHTALDNAATLRNICSPVTQLFVKQLHEKGTHGHASVPCAVCHAPVSPQSLLRRYRASGPSGAAHRSVSLCIKCNLVPGFKGNSYAQEDHTLPHLLAGQSGAETYPVPQDAFQFSS